MFSSFRIQNHNIDETMPIITLHLELLEEKIAKYFPELNIENYDCIRNPFAAGDRSNYHFSLTEEEEFIKEFIRINN